VNLQDYNYHLPPELIAQEPSKERDISRLLVLNSITGEIHHRIFHDFPEYVNKNDLLVVNNTKVFPARLIGKREKTGGEYEIFLLKEIGKNIWDALAKKHSRLKIGTIISVGDGTIRISILEKNDNGHAIVKLESDMDIYDAINNAGKVPLPPYIRREPSITDKDRYQTVYASERGSVAAPTAGLHFTDKTLAELREKGCETAEVTLHVGIGTFRPLNEDDADKDILHSEFCIVPGETSDSIKKCRDNGGKVFAVGTTSARSLETASATGIIAPFRGETNIFIKPPYKFRSVDNLLTNFHLPKSSLLMLVCAFAGRDNIMKAYSEAIEKKYRFYSYGDAMLIIGRDN